jgi:chemotaxis protein MotB
MAGKGGGAWKVAYADFVTAMMAFFMVMWLTSQDDEVKQAIGGYFQDPWGTSAEDSSPSFQSPTGIGGAAPFADTPNGVLKNRWPQSNMQNATEKEPGAASVWQQKHKVHLLNNDRTLPALVVNFNEGSADLPQEAQQRLTDLLPALVGKRNRIELRSHATRRPLAEDSPYKDHWQLCYERSLSVMRYLLENGIESDRIRLSQSSAYEPLTTRLESAWQNENNCVEVFLLTQVVDKMPGTAPGVAPSRAPAVEKPAEATHDDHDEHEASETPAADAGH